MSTAGVSREPDREGTAWWFDASPGSTGTVGYPLENHGTDSVRIGAVPSGPEDEYNTPLYTLSWEPVLDPGQLREPVSPGLPLPVTVRPRMTVLILVTFVKPMCTESGTIGDIPVRIQTMGVWHSLDLALGAGDFVGIHGQKLWDRSRLPVVICSAGLHPHVGGYGLGFA